MTLLATKGWKTQDYFNRYAELKKALAMAFYYRASVQAINEIVAELEDVLNQLNICGVSDRDLLLLSMNIDKSHLTTLGKQVN